MVIAKFLDGRVDDYVIHLRVARLVFALDAAQQVPPDRIQFAAKKSGVDNVPVRVGTVPTREDGGTLLYHRLAL